jgi:hypothetical protein
LAASCCSPPPCPEGSPPSSNPPPFAALPVPPPLASAGFRCVLRLLRCGAEVVVTTRFPKESVARFTSQSDFECVAALHPRKLAARPCTPRCRPVPRVSFVGSTLSPHPLYFRSLKKVSPPHDMHSHTRRMPTLTYSCHPCVPHDAQLLEAPVPRGGS